MDEVCHIIFTINFSLGSYNPVISDNFSSV